MGSGGRNARRLDQEIETALASGDLSVRETGRREEGREVAGHPWGVVFDARPYREQVDSYRREEQAHRVRARELEAKMVRAKIRAESVAPRLRAEAQREAQRISDRISGHLADASIAAGRAASAAKAESEGEVRSSLQWERKIDVAKRRASREAAVREGIAVVGRRIGIGTLAGPAGDYPGVASTAKAVYYAESPEFRIGGPGSTIVGEPELPPTPRGTTTVWRPGDDERYRAQYERERREREAARRPKTAEEWYQHDLREARQREERERRARERHEARRPRAPEVSEQKRELPVATTHNERVRSGGRRRASSFLRGLLSGGR